MGIPGGYAALGEQWLRTFDVRLKKPASGLHGRAFPKTRDLVVPWPTNTRKRLYILAHEIAHVVLDHKRQRPAYVQEFEAETFAHGLMRLFGIRVPRKMTVGAQQYVRRKILARPQRRFAHWIDPTIAEWAGLYGLNYKAPPGKPKNYHQTSIRRVEAALAAVPVAALAAAKAKGKKLGASKGEMRFAGRQGEGAAEGRIAAANARAQALSAVLAQHADKSANAAAQALNDARVSSPRGGKWTARSVINVRQRLAPA